MADSDAHETSDALVKKRYFGAADCANVVLTTVRLAQNVVRELPLHTGGCVWENVFVMEYI